MRLRNIMTAVTIGLVSTTSPFALESLNDDELSNVTGQAPFISIENSLYNQGAGEWEGNYEFTKVNLGLDLETVFNIDELKVGKFERQAYVQGTVPKTDDNRNILRNPDGSAQVYDSDIIINNFALGRVDNSNNAAVAEFVPFRAADPYLEFAYKVENGQKRIAGLRFGFDRAQGDLSGELVSLTGKLEAQIRGRAGVVRDQNCPGAGFGNCLALLLATNTEIYTQVDLVDGSTGNGSEQLATPYLKRASWIGVPNGRNFNSDDGVIGLFIPALTRADDCEVVGTPGCFRTNKYESIYIGDKGTTFDSGAARGVFISTQTESVPWQDLSGVPGANRIFTQRGGYLNIARYQSGSETKYPLNLTLEEATLGTSRVTTCVGRLKGC